ncbi:MAG: ABC transporter ATP-binding protein [Oribacterium sp.]|jgi:ATP-binding cassette subfamily B protein|nr:ABC transporter ATP-binding protein [Oribacterium sp.]MDY6307830.1 ABC transporter ATP-binding protein [Oribacterium sp.]MDY6317882.1 ABC transporter ATP-binding protein [Oribacterium sp.]
MSKKPVKKMTREETRTVFGKVLHVIGNYSLLLFLSVLLAAVSVILQLYIPILFGQAIDYILGPSQVDFAAIAVIMKKTLFFIILASLVTWVMNLINNRLTYRTVADIRAKAIRRIQEVPLSYLDRNSEGDIVQRVIADVDQLSDGLLLGFSELFSGIVMIVATLIFMLQRSVSITLMVMILTPVSFLVARFIAGRSFSMFQRQTEVRGQQTALINEMVGSEKVVKAFNYGERASERFDKINKDLQKYSVRAIFFSSLTNPSTRAVNAVIYALVALVGSFMILGGRLTVGTLTVLLTYANQYMKPFNDISSVFTELTNAMACAARVFELIEAEPQSTDPVVELPKPVKGDVSITDVSFSYTKDKPLIEHFNLSANAGRRIAIVGPTGCGKTTFINLLMRFYDVNAGTIRIDGTDTQLVSRHSLRESFGMVLQDTWLMNGTVRENIAFGRPEASDEEIITAAKEAHSWDFIRRLPKKLDTIINDDDLSQGQKQLLCITRVMLCHPSMLILDEATSSIDTRTELLVQDAFDKLMKGRTSFIVAHRLSTIRNADAILVMKDGHIIEQGTHDELLAAGGFYKTLYEAQFAGVAT